MTKIEWIGDTRQVPTVGILAKGDVRNVPEEIAEGLIKDKLAKKYLEKEPKEEKEIMGRGGKS